MQPEMTSARATQLNLGAISLSADADDPNEILFRIGCSAMQGRSLPSILWPQTGGDAFNTSCSAVLHDRVTKTDSYKIQHVYVEGSDRLYRSPNAADVSDQFLNLRRLRGGCTRHVKHICMMLNCLTCIAASQSHPKAGSALPPLYVTWHGKPCSDCKKVFLPSVEAHAPVLCLGMEC